MADRKLSPADEFDKALAEHSGEFGVRLSEEDRARLGVYYSLVLSWNPRLHLVAPCPPAEFATRHVLESLLALRFLTQDASVVDVGSGAGLPVIPCLIVRPDVRAVLIEASKKKSVFLQEALSRLERRSAARVVAERFERVEPPAADFLTCRALERFTETLPEILRWSASVRTLLLFGGETLRAELERSDLPFEAVLAPASERRFLFVVRRAE
ncbi:MAG TPA: 16S rRNA (guanine(527)-N(7))-methyltransferase RsmG [Pyrinomonadaceae bacterium]|nr:16S rRNA (guanine(527)-N(7))-methyltransferase RsmG [Pyrinomonadaceae bacterium]